MTAVDAAPERAVAAEAHRRRPHANMLMLAGGQSVTWSTTLVWTLIVPRRLGPDGMGLLVTGWAITGIVGVALGLGTRNYLVREMAAGGRRGGQLMATAIALRLGLVLPAFLLVAAYLRLGGFGGEQSVIVYVMTAGVVLALLAEPLRAGFQAIERMEYLAFGDIADKVFQGLGGIALVLLGFGALALSGEALAVAALVLVLNLAWMRRYFRIPARTSVAEVRTLVSDSLAFWAFGLFFTVYLWIDSVMLSLMAPTEVVGWYGVPVRLFGTLMFAAIIISTAWLPRLTVAHAEGTRRLRETARAPLELVLILSLPLAAGTAVVAGPLVGALYGSAFAQSVPVLVILALCIPLIYLNIMANQVLIAAGRQLVWTKVMAGATVLNPVLNLALIPAFQSRLHNGAVGAAISFLVTELAIAAAAVVLVAGGVLDRNSCQRLARTILATGVMVAATLAARPAGVVPQVAAGALTFTVAALALRVPTADEMTAGEMVARRFLGAAHRRTHPRASSP